MKVKLVELIDLVNQGKLSNQTIRFVEPLTNNYIYVDRYNQMKFSLDDCVKKLEPDTWEFDVETNEDKQNESFKSKSFNQLMTELF